MQGQYFLGVHDGGLFSTIVALARAFLLQPMEEESKAALR